MSREDLIRKYLERAEQAERAGLVGKLSVVFEDLVTDLQSLTSVDTGDRLMSTTEAAPYLGIKPETVADWCAAGKLPGARKTSGDTGEWRIPSRVVHDIARGEAA